MTNRGEIRWSRRALAVLVAAGLAVAGCSGGDDGSAEGPAGPDGTEAPAAYPRDDELRLNEIQVLGTHNSYHLRPQPAFAAALEELLPGVVANWQYGHLPLRQQLDEQGIRQFELDVWADPEGGLYAERKAQAAAGLPLEPHPELREPGTKVLHIMEVDAESSCLSFVACLTEIEAWSSANPGHVPLMVLVEAKQDAIPDPFEMGFVTPIPWTADLFDDLDAEIRSVFDDDQLITPDLVRGDHDSLEQAILTDGWPRLGDVRGRVMFALDNGGEVMEAYQDGHPSLEGRVMFTGGDRPGTPETAFIKLNDAVGDRATIEDVVRRGYLVRTRADAGSVPGDEDVVAIREAALAGGAQFVSTDYPVPDPEIDPSFRVVIPGGTPARCNPVSAPDWCTPADVEDPNHLRR